MARPPKVYTLLEDRRQRIADLLRENAALTAALREHGGFHAPKDCGDKHRPHGNAKPGTTCFYCEPALSDAGEGWLPPEAREQVREALEWADRVLTCRDNMNGAIHCEDPRISPVTAKVKAALDELEGE